MSILYSLFFCAPISHAVILNAPLIILIASFMHISKSFMTQRIEAYLSLPPLSFYENLLTTEISPPQNVASVAATNVTVFIFFHRKSNATEFLCGDSEDNVGNYWIVPLWPVCDEGANLVSFPSLAARSQQNSFRRLIPFSPQYKHTGRLTTTGPRPTNRISRR